MTQVERDYEDAQNEMFARVASRQFRQSLAIVDTITGMFHRDAFALAMRAGQPPAWLEMFAWDRHDGDGDVYELTVKPVRAPAFVHDADVEHGTRNPLFGRSVWLGPIGLFMTSGGGL